MSYDAATSPLSPHAFALLGQFLSLPENDQITVRGRYEWCSHFLKLEAAHAASRADRSMATAIDMIRADLIDIQRRGLSDLATLNANSALLQQAPSPRTLRRWLKALEDADGNPLILRSQYWACGRRRSS